MSEFNILDEVKSLEAALKCGVCKELLKDPLLVAKCGHSICRQCFVTNFDMKCPICGIPANRKDSLDDKLLKELLLQLKKLKQIVENDVSRENLKGAPIPINEDTSTTVKCQETSQLLPRNIDNILEDEKTIPKTDGKEATPCTSQNITPKVRRKKISPRSKVSRLSSVEDVNVIQGTPDSCSKTKLSSSLKRKSFTSSRSEENKISPSLNVSSLSSSNLNKKNHKGETLLHRFVIKGDIEKVKELIAQGASVNTQDNNGWTPLHEASNHGFVEIAKLLLDNGALVNVPSLKDNITPLHDALINDQMQIAILLVSRGADMYAKTSMGYTAFDLCKDEEDKNTLLKSCSPFISANIPVTNKKASTDDGRLLLLYTGLEDKQKEKLQKFAQLFKVDLIDNFTPEVTHIITSCDSNGNCVRTMKVLLGILTGKWIINYQWIEVCLEYKQKVDEEVFEVQGTKTHPNTQGPKSARLNAEQKFPLLFDGFYFYLHGNFHKPIPEREDLCNLIHVGGGKILSREPREDTVASDKYLLPYHAQGTPVDGVSHIILFQDKPPRDHHFRRGHISTTHVIWLIECISEFKLKDFKQNIDK